MINHDGFSPSQIVFGKNSNLPNIINDTLPALEKVTTSADLVLHIGTFHSAREAFMKAQTSEKNKIALKKQTRQTREKYELNEEVHCQRDTDEQWKRPVKVLGQDGAVVFLQHGSRLIKAHARCVQPVKSTFPIIPGNEKGNKYIDIRSISESESDREMENKNTT